ncbi:bifunctional Helicase [Babesia duncani]|uniref:Bifunctional Helicase n=1 Tax=Babesia duncani TaxID=323732 RepID=A0AAD9UPC1_9APIC|nr:bifunctional Helicase [Babesia duncani]
MSIACHYIFYFKIWPCNFFSLASTIRHNDANKRNKQALSFGFFLNFYMKFRREMPAIALIRAPLLGMLSVEQEPVLVMQPFKSPLQGHNPGQSAESQRKTLGCRVRSFSKGFLSSFKVGIAPKAEIDDEGLPPDNPLILYNEGDVEIKVDSLLSRFLRDHQRQGVAFIFNCLMGLKDFDGRGCILADDMGLGKTLQSITVMWTLLNQGLDGRPAARKCAIICPASLVNNWESEIGKWLRGKCPCTAVADSCREKVVGKFQGFKYEYRSRVIIASYETFRMHVDKLAGVPIDLVICDEAHRLKNDKTLTSVSIAKLPAKMRLMLSGTPIQNDLNEFYALVSLCNPNVLGDAATFRRVYANPILLGRDPDASDAEQQIASERLAELSRITNQFVLRRTNALLSKVLPPKLVFNVFCNLAPCQRRIYEAFTKSKSWTRLINANGSVSSRTLTAIQSLMKLCNHPCLIHKGGILSTPGVDKELAELEKASGGTGRTGQRQRLSCSEQSGKVLLLHRLLHQIRTQTNDRVVIISNYTSTLDVFERLCRECHYPFMRLDGALSIKKRHKLVTTFNDPHSGSFIFLLSSKAGGCGINLIGANRLVLFDPDWNPANDKQALARIWRDGQKKTCYIYRFFSTGTIEEKIYQRQICKDGLSSMIVTEGANELKDSLSGEYLQNIFDYKTDTMSDTHDSLNCSKCKDANPAHPAHEQDENFAEDDLNTWAHFSDVSMVPDALLVKAATVNEPLLKLEDETFSPVSFVIACKVQFDAAQATKDTLGRTETVSTACQDDDDE